MNCKRSSFFTKALPAIMLISSRLVSASKRNLDFPLGGAGKVIHIKSATDFCTFLPPTPDVTIVDSEGYPTTDPIISAPFAVAFCTNPKTAPDGAKPIYDGFITGVMFHKENSFISISGTIDPSKAGLKLDGGGYYDLDHNVNSPPGLTWWRGICDGYDSFYNQINPVDGIFCVKCCVGITTCRIDLAETVNGGCRGMVPGTYTPGYEAGTWNNTGFTVVNGKVVSVSPSSDPTGTNLTTATESALNSANEFAVTWMALFSRMMLAML